MSRKRTVYPTQLKTHLVLELLKGQKRVNEIASEHNNSTKPCYLGIYPTQWIQIW